MKKFGEILLTLALVGTLPWALASCGKDPTTAAGLKDGVYVGEYQDDSEYPSKGKAEIKIEKGKIISCTYEERDGSGKIKDQDYGKDAGADKYELAQDAVKGMQTYGAALVQKQDLDLIDSVSGATVSFKMFQESVKAALEQAK